jgi:hypothetical protein
MKIVALLALLISLCCAFEDVTFTDTANATQAYGGYYGDSPGYCEATISWTESTMTIDGSVTCYNLKGNVTAMHIHDCGASSSVTYNVGPDLKDIVIPVPTDPTVFPWTFTAKLATKDSINAICNDQTYLNVHTTYDSAGEVRANFVNKKALCNIPKYAADGTVYVYGATDGLTGVKLPDFCIGGLFGTATVGTGNCEFQICWEQATAILTVSGNCYGLTSNVYGIYVNFPDDTSSYFIYLSGYTFPQTCPFSFHYTSVSEWQLAKIISQKAYITIQTSDNTDGEIQVDVKPVDGATSGFPAWESACYPRTGDLPEKALTCYNGYEGYEYTYDCSADQLCAISDFAGDEYKTCSTWGYCYTCDCGADIATDLPASGYACCSTSYCNVVSLSVLFCLDGNGSSLIPGGLLVTIFVALLTKWFN